MSDEYKENSIEQTSQVQAPAVAPANNGERQAVTALVLGIISLACVVAGFTVVGAVAGIVLAIIGLVMAHKSSVLGCTNGKRTAGFVCSVVGLVLNCICVVLVCFGLAIAAVAMSCWWL